MPSTFFDPSFSLRRLRTTPARKPRTECCCQPVAFIIASIVAPAGDLSIPRTRACLEPGSLVGHFALLAANCAGLAMTTGVADRATARFFFADFDIEILRSGGGGHRAATTEAPRRPKGAGGGTVFFGGEAQDLPSRLIMLAVLRSVLTSETISSSPRATSMAFRVLPDPEQSSAAVAILSPFSRLARTSANEVFTVVSRLMASMGASFRHHTCLLCAGSRAECEQSYGSFGPSRITFGSCSFMGIYFCIRPETR